MSVEPQAKPVVGPHRECGGGLREGGGEEDRSEDEEAVSSLHGSLSTSPIPGFVPTMPEIDAPESAHAPYTGTHPPARFASQQEVRVALARSPLPLDCGRVKSSIHLSSEEALGSGNIGLVPTTSR